MNCLRPKPDTSTCQLVETIIRYSNAQFFVGQKWSVSFGKIDKIDRSLQKSQNLKKK